MQDSKVSTFKTGSLLSRLQEFSEAVPGKATSGPTAAGIPAAAPLAAVTP